MTQFVTLANGTKFDVREFTIGKVVFVGDQPSHVMGFSTENPFQELELVVKLNGERFCYPFSEILI